MTKYARDEFDRVPETSTRQGVHRAVAEARRRSLVPILTAGCLALAIGLVAFLILPKLGFSAGQTAAVTDGSSVSATPSATSSSPAPSSSAPASTAPVSPAATSPAPASTAPEASATPDAAAAAVDKTQPVTIYNGTTTAGLATRVGGTVRSAGWTVGQTDNWSGAPQQTSVIFYSSADQKDNAEALGALLGIDTLVESADFNLPLVVVIGPGFQ